MPISSILLHLCRYTTEMQLQKRQIWNQDLSPFGKLGDAGTAVMVDSTLQHVRFPLKLTQRRPNHPNPKAQA